MKRTDKKRQYALKIAEKFKDWHDHVGQLGNECAYTDRMIEECFELAEEFKEYHEKEFKQSH